MLFTPKSSKFKRYQKGSLCNKLTNISVTLFKNNQKTLKLVSTAFGSISTKQLTTVRFLTRKFIKKKGIIRFNCFPQRMLTRKPSEIRMGKGKGSFSHWVSNIKIGSVLAEIYYKDKFKNQITKFLKKLKIRLPIKINVK